MKIVNTYKYETVTWFIYKHLFELIDKLYSYKKYPESELLSWTENPDLAVNIGKPYETN